MLHHCKPAILLPVAIILSLGFILIAQFGLGVTDGSDTRAGKLTSLVRVSDSEFALELEPSAKERPLLQRALVTVFTQLDSNKTFDTQMADALVLAHSFNVLPRVDRQGVEFVVAMSGIGFSAETILLGFGGEAAFSPQFGRRKGLAIPENSYKECTKASCFAKLYLFGLEAFSDILYVDPAVVINAGFSTSAVFELSTGAGFFGAVPSLGLGENTLDSSVLLFKPSISPSRKIDFEGYYLDQSPSCTTWSRLPESLNLQLLASRSQESISSSQIIPHDFWTYKPSPKNPSSAIHSRWASSMRSLFDFQMNLYNYSNVGLIPTKLSDLDLMIRGNTFAKKFVIITIMSSKVEKKVFDRTMANRARYCERHPEVTHHLQSQIFARNAVWQKIWTLADLFGNYTTNHYDWAWLLDGRDAMIMNGEIELRSLVAKFAMERPDLDMDVLIARDISAAMNAGSFFVRNSKWTRDVFLPELKLYANHSQENIREHPWQEQWGIIRMNDDGRNDTTSHLYQVEQRRQNEFNSFTFGPEPTYRPGDLVVHAPNHGWKGLYSFLEDKNYKEY
ncbi:hypothetical protein BCR33DRAFT_716496 [Rhizoclosmatium globosum]|uniref:Nucleotide-diphospho-sugar transferase n=1 Tax=Rhizoclosmatium globosum TaxID=329046 RepID=A0A1Y2CDN5_9FUNG|nr:hypothetical protein BCR33DRAFT_716496 [Rhizoclosmatium globosum]|eukprot:ORY45168.1 hypothetical protein BCR33DRAFT_716496 [Rhizoclosmatium globosum]